MYICLECGEVFENYSEWTEPHGEDMCGCPHCGGAIEEAVACENCGEYFLEDDLINGMCEDCAEGEVYYDTALKYLTERHLLRDFFIVWYWEIFDHAPDTENEEFDNLLVSAFNQKVLDDKETYKTTFLEQLKEYILDDMYEWTEFLREEEKKNENSKN